MTLSTNSVGGLEQLANSGSLAGNLNGNNPFQQPTWSRSLSELYAAANQSLGKDGMMMMNQSTTAAAEMLLGSSRTDFSSIASSLSQAPTLSQPAGSSSTASSGTTPTTRISHLGRGMTLEEKTRNHRDSILERILRKEKDHAHQAFEQAWEERHEEDWAQERKWWMQELVGKRNVIVDPSSHRHRRHHHHPPSSSIGPTVTMLTSNTTSMTNSMSSNLLPGYAPRIDQTLDVKVAMEHSTILQADPKDWVGLLQQRSQDSGYATSWQLLGCIVPRLADSPVDGARGALIHLCRQYQVVVRTRVAMANLDRPMGNHGRGRMAGTVTDYCQLEKGSRASIWDSLYYCTYEGWRKNCGIDSRRPSS